MQNPLNDFQRDPDSLLCSLLSLPRVLPQQVQSTAVNAKRHGIEVKEVGRSFNHQPITLLTLGHGDMKVFAWSQMHGDEPTATAALLDFIALLCLPEYAPWRNQWQDKITLHLLPMLNPDGAELGTRENAQGIDINRDAAATQSPEGQLLKTLIDEIAPDVAFNLHDQNKYYAAGNKKLPATISFLSPPGDRENTLTPARKNAMGLISQFIKYMRPFIGEAMAKYQDEFSDRAFGDYASSQGASCILIESGACQSSPLREKARQMNLLALLVSIQVLAEPDWQHLEIKGYQQLPLNKENGITDLLIKGVHIHSAQKPPYKVDIAIDKDSTSVIREVGDLSPLQGFEVIEEGQLSLLQGKSFRVEGPFRLTRKKYLSLLKSGTLFFDGHTHLIDNVSDLPVLLANKAGYDCQDALLGRSGTLLLGIDDKAVIAVLDGVVLDLRH